MEPPSRKSSVSIQNQSGQRVRQGKIREGIEAVLLRHGRDGALVDVLLCDNQEMRDLNFRYRKTDSPTDVLSFPGDESHLGDIAIAIPIAKEQARLRGVSAEEEVAFLAIHGALHLVGFDDETDADRASMVEEMNRVAESVSLKPDHEWHSGLKSREREEPPELTPEDERDLDVAWNTVAKQLQAEGRLNSDGSIKGVARR